MAKKNKNKFNNRPVDYDSMEEDKVYMSKAHSYGELYKKEEGDIYFLTENTEGKYAWCKTMLDPKRHKFMPVNTDPVHLLGILLDKKYWDDSGV